jgi:hypothetical protein
MVVEMDLMLEKVMVGWKVERMAACLVFDLDAVLAVLLVVVLAD